MESVIPQVAVEVGWTEYRETLPEESRIYSTKIVNSRHPEWNQTILITNPSHLEKIKGFLMLTMKDNHNLEDLVRVHVPLESMGLFIPYNLKIVLQFPKDQNNPTTSPT